MLSTVIFTPSVIQFFTFVEDSSEIVAPVELKLDIPVRNVNTYTADMIFNAYNFLDNDLYERGE